MLRWGRDPERLSLASLLMRSAAIAVLVNAVVVTQVGATTLAGMRAASGLPTNPIPPAANPAPETPPLTEGQQSARIRQLQITARITDAAALAKQAQAAARAAAEMQTPTVPDGLTIGGLQQVANPVPAAQDPTGLHTWQGADNPTQTQTDGHTDVVIHQTESRAVLSWETFNVGRDTTVNFQQQVDGKPQKDWVALNRVVGQLNPNTGLRDPNAVPAPSQILGSIKADGTVLVLNQNGVLFSATAQVNTHSLVATSLEIGRAMSGSTALNIGQRNSEFLAFGLLGFADQAASGDQRTAFTFSGQQVDSTHADPLLEGKIEVQAGATITANDGGFILLAGPKVENGGALSAALGQVSLTSGRQITLRRSEGKTDSLDPNVRGFVVDVVSRPDVIDDYVLNNATGTIEAAQGYISLGATDNGATINAGVLQSTTSVTRNGFVRLTGGDIQLAPNSAIAIVADTGAQTIPQDPLSLAAFKPSRISIGSASSRIEMGSGSTIFAPRGNVDIGSLPGQTTIADPGTLHSRVFIDSGAVIDVSGMADVLIPASRNAIKIFPVKRNELRDSPTYRDDFLNGATVYVDPRKSGVREDGVAWIGSPLIEAGSFYQQVGVTAAELMTKGGNVTLGVASFTGADPAFAPDIIVKAGAEIDMAGGWVRYEAGIVQETRLIDASGRIVNISAADPNDTFVGQVTGFIRMQPRWGITESWISPLLVGSHAVGEYTEGRDAGSLTIKGSVAVLDGTVHADAFAGRQQLADAARGTATSGIYGDHRAMQGAPSQLPSGGFLFVQALGKDQSGNTTGGADIAIVDGAQYQPLASDFTYGGSVSVDANGALMRPVRDPASFLPPERRDTIALSDDALNGMGLSQLSLVTSGKVTVAAGSETHLNPGGSFDALSGRAITIDGAVYVPGGAINLETASLIGGGSVVAPDEQQLGSFDININGTLSTRGRWANDYGEQDGGFVGSAYTDGGNITIVAAPRVTLTAETETVDDTKHDGAPTVNTDISGSILINDGATVDVSGGGYVRQNGSLDLTARGGNLSLYAETNYFQLVEDVSKSAGGIEGFRVSTLININSGQAILPVNPDHINARVAIADGSILAAGFAGGGTFTLSTPEFQFGDTVAATGTNLAMDFFSTAGFANYNITSYKTALIENKFTNGFGGFNAVLATQTLTVGAGETLSLSQAMFNAVPTADETASLRSLATGGDLYSVLTPGVPTAVWDRHAVSLILGGLIELHVAQGGRIEGDPGTHLTVSKLFNEDTIRLPGGTITQSEILPNIYVNSQSLAVHDLGDVFTIEADGTIKENANNAAGIRQQGGGPVLKNAQLADQYSIYLLGELEANEGVRLAAGSVLDLSGTSVINPRAIANGIGSPTPIRDGRMVAGGTLALLPGQLQSMPIFHGSSGNGDYSTHNPGAVRSSALLVAEAGSSIDISGAADTFDELNRDGRYAPTQEWSNAGTLLLGNGGIVTGATLDAHGGADKALGGTLIVLDPVLYQDDPLTPTIDAISANAIAAQGFDTMEALGSITSSGDVTLDLGRGFFLATRPFGNFPDQDLNSPAVRDALAPVVRSGGNFIVNAPYVRLESNFQTYSSPSYGTPGANSITFNADTIDIAGAVLFDRSIANAQLNAAHDVRLIGVQPYQRIYNITGADVPSSLAGMLAVNGNLTITAGQVYPTTGSTFLITSTLAGGTIAFARAVGDVPATPYSAGGNLTVQAANIVQGGVVRVPLGHLNLGGTTELKVGANPFAPVTDSVRATDGSVTSVSADGLIIPYGTTTDQIEWFFEPTGADALNAPPSGVLAFAATDVTLDHGAEVNIKGGGDLYAYEFISGTGGSRDELDRFNADPFSGNDGLQYPGGKQVFAIVPGLSNAAVAAYDPIYSSDYADLTGVANAGMRVFLHAAPGLAEGWYTLLPAKYALLPGGMRVMMRSDSGGLVPDAHATLLDGTVVTTGYAGTTGGEFQSSKLLAFDIQSQSVFRSYSNIAQTLANATFAARAARNGLTAPRLPIDAGRIVLNPTATLAVNTTIDSAAAQGGRGAQADISGASIEIVSDLSGPPAPPGTIVLTADSLTNLNASSLLLGGVRTENADGTTTLDITATSIEVANDAAHPLTAPEVLLAVDGAGATIVIDDGAAIVANGSASAGGDYIIDESRGTMTGQGALVRVANGPERLVTRKNPDAVAPGVLAVGAAAIIGKSVLLDSSGDLTVDPAATIEAEALALDAGKVTFTGDPAGFSGLVITPTLQALFGQADQLTIRSPGTIDLSAGHYAFGNLRLDTPGLLLLDGSAVDIAAAKLTLGNSSAEAAACVPACGTGALTVAADEIAFGSGTVRTYGFGDSVSLTAQTGMFYQGKGAFDAGTAALTIDTPFLGDRAVSVAIGASTLIPIFALSTTGAVAVRNTSGASAPANTDGVPGAQLTIEGDSIDVRGARLRATAGNLKLTSQTGIAVADGAYLETPGYSRRFGDEADHTDVSAPGGRLALTALNGDIEVAVGATLSVGGGKGRAGTLAVSAANGGVFLNGTIGAVAPEGGGSLVLESGVPFNLSAFSAGAAHAFDGLIDIHTRSGDLVLLSGDTLTAGSVRLTADEGAVDIAGTIDVSGVNGGDVGLYGTHGVALRDTAVIDAHADGYAATDTRTAHGGDVALGTGGAGAITVESGALIDVSAAHTADRLVPQIRNGTLYYTYVQGDRGGTVSLRAPVIEQPGADTVNVSFQGSIDGARSIVLEGYKPFDLANIANDPDFVGVTINGSGQVELDLAAVEAGKLNWLADDGTGTLVSFVQDFDVSGAYGNLGGILNDTDAAKVFHARAGMDLEYSGDIVLVSNWNLGAGVVDVTRAVNDGLMAPVPSAPGKFYVIPGKEAELFAGYTTMVYRTDTDHDGFGNVDGEPGVLTLRAGGTLDIKGSISDGFFQFRDQTDPDYLNVALGGGNQFYTASLITRCLGSCADVGAFVAGTPPTNFVSLNIPSGSGLSGILHNPIPYSVAANSPAAWGSFPDNSGDPIGSMELFPLIDTGNGRHAVDSSSIRLVGGATASVDPLRTRAGGGSDVIVEGSHDYTFAGVKGATHFDDTLLLRVGATSLTADEWLAAFLAANPGMDANAYTFVNFGTAPVAFKTFLNDQAKTYFASHPGEFQFTGPPNAPTGVNTTIALAAAFMTDVVAPNFMNFNDLYTPGPPTLVKQQTTATSRTLVRTGTGDIAVAAAANIDLTNGAAVYRKADGTITTPDKGLQSGGTSIYTAGHVADLTPRLVFDPVSGDMVLADPGAFSGDEDIFANPPSLGYRYGAGGSPQTSGTGFLGILLANPQYAEGGGDVSLGAGGDVKGRREIWREDLIDSNNASSATLGDTWIGTGDQPWRSGHVNGSPDIRVNAQLFNDGVGTLGGGDIHVSAGGDVSDLSMIATTAVSTASVATGGTAATLALATFGGGNVDVAAGHDILGGRLDMGSGAARIAAGNAIAGAGQVKVGLTLAAGDNLFRIRLMDATVDIEALQSVVVQGIAALSAHKPQSTLNVEANLDAFGFYSADAGVSFLSDGTVSVTNHTITNVNKNPDLLVPVIRAVDFTATAVYPGTLEVASLAGAVDLRTGGIQTANAILLYPSPRGNLSLYSAATIGPVTIAVDDTDPGILPGAFSSYRADEANGTLAGRTFIFPGVLPDATDVELSQLHNRSITHANDVTVVRIYSGGDINGMILSVPKHARIGAARDIVNMMFFGQNVHTDDITRIAAGRDIIATTKLVRPVIDGQQGLGTPQAALQGNTFVIGGPGSFFLEAGRDAGPFLNSAVTNGFSILAGIGDDTGTLTYGGGVLSIGNSANRALPEEGADLYVMFGVGPGAEFTAFRDYYVDPANVANLDDDLFEQTRDDTGAFVPDRSKPIYAPILIAWMKANAATELQATYGTTDVTYEQAFDTFKVLPELQQRVFLVGKVYFNELAAPSIPDGPSFKQYSRGYLAVNTLFPSSLGYTQNDLSGGGNGANETIETGNLDLRLATIQTQRAGDVFILGPGGRVLAGSTVRTSVQAARRTFDGGNLFRGIVGNDRNNFFPAVIQSIPTGYEGILTLRGGTINSFTDGDFLLNQSRLFTEAGGDIVMWSSNGDLNAGQGPKTSASFPPVVVRIDENGFAEVDAVGGVSGAGIGAFQPDPDAEAPSVFLIAPRGTVDAGDAGVRVAGSLFVAALTVANAENFSVGGSAFGIPTSATVDVGAAASANAASSAAQQAAASVAGARAGGDLASIITVEVLGFANDCPPNSNDPKCRQQ